MAKDLKNATTEELRAEYEPKRLRAAELRKQAEAITTEIEPIRAELGAREHRATLVLNAVIDGKQDLLRAAGTPESVIKSCEDQVAAMKADKLARRQDPAVSPSA